MLSEKDETGNPKFTRRRREGIEGGLKRLRPDARRDANQFGPLSLESSNVQKTADVSKPRKSQNFVVFLVDIEYNESMPTALKIRAFRIAQRLRRAFNPKQRAHRAFTLPELRGRSRAFTLKPRGRFAFTWPKQRGRSAFTLIELLVVMGIIIILTALLAPAFTSLKSAGDVTSAAYTIKGVLEQARTYAMANNTYAWVGFFEEDGSVPSPATAGTGRLVMSIVASKDGTMMYTGTLSSPVTLNPTNLIQIGKLTKIDSLHLLHLESFPPTTPTGDTFGTRPAVSSTAAQIGDDTPPNPSLTFQYPVGSSSAQYNFVKVVQFSPRSEAVIDNSNYTFTPVSEIGIQPAHGSTPDTASSNVCALQFTGMGGNVKVYRR